MRHLYAVIATTLLAGSTFAATINVPADYATIQEAVNAASNGDEIIVAPGTYTSTQDGHTINMIGKSVTLRSIDPDDPAIVAATVIDGEGVRRGIACFNGESPVIAGFTIRHGFGSGFDYNADGQVDWWEEADGGVFFFNSSPQLILCTIQDNVAGTSSGGVRFHQSNGAMIDCSVTNNSAPNGVGGIGIYSNSSPSIIRCDIRNNTAEYGAAAMNIEYSCSPILNECIFAGNTTPGIAAGIFIEEAQPEFNYCIFEENSATWAGGGCYFLNSEASFTGCRFTGNLVSTSWEEGMYGDGGAICSIDSSLVISNSLFDFNAATRGTAIYVEDGSLNLSGSTFHHNDGGTGGILGNGASLQISNCEFYANSVYWDGGAINAAWGQLEISNCLIEGNHATYHGGGIRIYGSKAQITDSMISNNNADQTAGGLLAVDTVVDVSNTVFCGNQPDHIVGDIAATNVEFMVECPPECDGDYNYDGAVNVGDLLEVIAGWNDPYNVDDLLLVIQAWGPCP